MNQEIKQKWLAALRSGEYEQGTQTLRSFDNKFCCMGVLCDLYIKEKNAEGEKVEWNINLYRNTYSFEQCISLTPNVVLEWAGIDIELDLGPYVSNPIEGYESDSVGAINDMGVSFVDVAKALEESGV